MRHSFLALLLLSGPAALAQDPAQQAIQQQLIIDQQQQIVQQQIQQQQLSLINQQQLDQTTAANLGSYQLTLRTPHIDQQPGTKPGTVLVTMRDSSRGTSLFYTTDGWTPTPASERYLGPVTVSANTTLRVIAIAAGGLRSHVAVLPITVTPGAATLPPTPPQAVTTLAPGTSVPLVFTGPVVSRGSKVGDSLPVALAADLVIDGKTVASSGSPVDTIVTGIDNSHVQGIPGVLSFAVRSVSLLDGTKLPLLGVETMEGADRTRSAGVASIVPLGGLAFHGGDAVIPTGSRFDAQIADPPRKEAQASSPSPTRASTLAN